MKHTLLCTLILFMGGSISNIFAQRQLEIEDNVTGTELVEFKANAISGGYDVLQLVVPTGTTGTAGDFIECNAGVSNLFRVNGEGDIVNSGTITSSGNISTSQNLSASQFITGQYLRTGGNGDGAAWTLGNTGQAIFRGADSNGTSAGPINLRSGTQSMWMDGNEIDSNEFLALNFNTNNDVRIRNADTRRADLTFEHTTGGGNTDGFAIENEDTNNRWWTFYVLNSTGDLQLYNDGAVRAEIDETSGAYNAVSDRRLKDNLRPLQNVLPKVMQVEPLTYNFIHDDTNTDYLGFIAQEISKQFPEVARERTVGDTEEAIYTMDYTALGVIALQAVKEQQAIIQDLQKEIAELKAQIK